MSPSQSIHPMDVPVLLLLTLVAIGATCMLAPSLTAAVDVDTASRPAVGSFPRWLPVTDYAILEASSDALPIDVVVSQDGTGNYTTVMAAVDAAPPSGRSRYAIHIRGGTYDEYVSIKTPNVVFIGDGMGVTVITGSHSVADGWSTFDCGTVIVSKTGIGFIARDLTITNTAGPTKGQAVALRSSADLSIFYRCSFEGYQDTLYAHSDKQFYRECRITGTVDFIFGNAAAVFQFCLILARRPLPGQANTITAQGRDNIDRSTGFTLQNCNISADSDLAPYIEQIHSYLGRPWRNHSTTVVMETYIGSLIQPEGWLEWNGSFALDTLYYGEYMNSGPGSGLRGRVKWPGYHIITDPAVATNFTVGRLIDGDSWLPSTGIIYKSGL